MIVSEYGARRMSCPRWDAGIREDKRICWVDCGAWCNCHYRESPMGRRGRQLRNRTARLGMRVAAAAQAVLRLRHLPWLLVMAVFLFALVQSAWLCDDAFISFRTADNFVHGYGLTWNVQERVQTYTNPLWLFLFSAVYFVTREPFYTGIFLSLAVSAAAVGLFAGKIARSAPPRRWASWRSVARRPS